MVKNNLYCVLFSGKIVVNPQEMKRLCTFYETEEGKVWYNLFHCHLEKAVQLQYRKVKKNFTRVIID